jgi:hypothetical protein
MVAHAGRAAERSTVHPPVAVLAEPGGEPPHAHPLPAVR